MEQIVKLVIGFLALMVIFLIGAVAALFIGIGAIAAGGNIVGGGGPSGTPYVNCMPDPLATPGIPTPAPVLGPGTIIPSPGPGTGGCPPGTVPVPLPSGGLVGFDPDVAAAIIAAAAKYGLDPCLLGALAMQESGGNPNAKSGDGGYGLFQITPGNGQSFTTDLQANVNAGAAHIANDLKNAGGNTQQALILYNCGGCKGDPNFTTGRAWPGSPPPAYWPPGTTNHYPGSCVINGTTCLSYPDSVMKFESQVCPAPPPKVGYIKSIKYRKVYQRILA